MSNIDNQVFDSANKPTGLKRLALALQNSFRALQWLLQNEAAFKQEMWLLVISLVIVGYWDISLYEKGAIIISVLLVVFAEIANTAIEHCIDRIGYEIHPLSGRAKDLGSALVFVSMMISTIVWFVILMTYITA